MKKGHLEKLSNDVHLEEERKNAKSMAPRNNNWNESEGAEQCRMDGEGSIEKKIVLLGTERYENILILYINKNIIIISSSSLEIIIIIIIIIIN